MTPPRRRVLMTADAVGGVWTYATTLAAALAGRGHTVLLVTLGPEPGPAQRAALSATDGVELVTTDLSLEWMDPEGHDLPRARDVLGSIAEEWAPDIVQLGGFREATIRFGVPALVVAHSCVRSWWRACRGGEPDAPRWRPYLDNVAAGLAAADAWAAPTRAFRDLITSLYAPLRDGAVIPNGIAMPDPPSRRARRPVVLAAGRLWDEAKGIDTLLAAAPTLPWAVRIAGATTAPDGGPTLAAPDTVTLLGMLDQASLHAEMQAAEIFVAPARYEPFGLTIAEAAACGAVLVLSDIPTLRELWDGAAAFVPTDAPSALAAAVTALAAEPARRGALRRAAQARAATYTVDAMTDRIESLHQTLIAGDARRTAIAASLTPEAVA
ncbi:glycosyltransferase family 4 protein [Rhodoplanes elegans]|nr:glycosyltransferase family 4 protein [Rhodoplanes elegans]